MSDGSIQPEVVETAPKKRGRPKKEPSTALAKAPEADDALIQKAEAFATEALALVSEIVVRTQEDMDGLGEDLAEAAKIDKELEESLKALTAPLRKKENEHRAKYRPAQNLISKLVLALKQIGADFIKLQQAEQDAKLREIAESGGKADPKTLAIAHGIGQVAVAKEMSPREVWKWRETGEPIEERFYMRVLNTAAIDAEVKELKDKFKAAGIEAYRDIQINKARSVT